MPTSFRADMYRQFIHISRYARWLPEHKRRETWEETVSRYFDFFEKHLKEHYNYTLRKDARQELENAVLAHEIMPSMRCLMTAGEALEKENVAGYNCSYVAVDSPRSFDEILYILMNGTGVGFSVESQFVEQLPRVADEFHDTNTCIDVADSKLGWAKALKELLAMLYVGQVPTWDVSKVRPAGAPLKTFGGRASGPDPLVELFKFCVRTFKNAAGRRLTTLECHDIVCKIAEIVVVGGVRRSALISLSDLHDDRMRHAKNGEWWNMNSQRALSNNSYVAQRERPTLGTFLAEWTALYESKSGERGIFSRYGAQTQATKTGRRDADRDFGTNPCCLPADALITTDQGPRTLGDIVSGHAAGEHIMVAGVDIDTHTVIWTPVEGACATRPNAELIRLVIEDETGSEHTVELTPDHHVFTKNRGYVEAAHLTSEDEVVIKI